MTKELPRDLAMAQLRLRSLFADMPLTCESIGESAVKFSAEGLIIDKTLDTPITLTRLNFARAPRSIVFSLRDLRALARLESDHPARAPIRETPPRLSAPPPADKRRLVKMLAAVLDIMLDGEFRTLEDIQEKLALEKGLRHQQPAISARLRDLRKAQFGGWTVEREPVKGTRALHRYRVVPESGS